MTSTGRPAARPTSIIAAASPVDVVVRKVRETRLRCERLVLCLTAYVQMAELTFPWLHSRY
ncbi:hypothetical protein PsorP6_011024 [Peronosclerospora sorghi]|uniref:Uncharacterized protein n=1 Tax=Peronosclerospora sorghi TaxID=230839 RepID=A0ACC0VWZ0_9STRA|nr:hypothetical protein PsorP6_011024 [Peronosclerospora sorghi]